DIYIRPEVRVQNSASESAFLRLAPHFLDARETIHAIYNDHVMEAAREVDLSVDEEPANSLQYEDRDDQSRAHNDKQQAENCDDKYPIASSRSRGRGRVAAEQFVVAHVRLEPERERIAQPRNNPD